MTFPLRVMCRSGKNRNAIFVLLGAAHDGGLEVALLVPVQPAFELVPKALLRCSTCSCAKTFQSMPTLDGRMVEVEQQLVEICLICALVHSSWVISMARRRRSLMECGALQRARSDERDDRVEEIFDCE